MPEQMNMFEYLYPHFSTNKKIRLIELFAGYGSQALALKYLGIPFEHWKICEWNYKSFQAYKDIHMPDDHTDYSALFTKEWLIECLFKAGISSNWNEPMKYEQIKRLNESKLREIYNNISATHNLVDVSKIHANDLQIINKDQYTYILTYSFPCQDLSLAGRREGMDRGSETRSGLLWEVERILLECKEENCLPDVLLMENVPQVHGIENARNWREWLIELEQLGYQSYWQDMMASDYGIPQTRYRTVCVSIMGEYSYAFPQPIKLCKRHSDLLEEAVDAKYYLSKRALDYAMETSFSQAKLEARVANANGCIPTLLARDHNDPKLVIEDQARQKVRKMTPKEYFRHMGVKDEEYQRAEKNQNKADLYHLAGDSIVSTCLMAIFGELLGVDWKERVDKLHG